MIVEMRKINVLCAAQCKGESLDRLRDVGVVHIEHVVAPESADLETARDAVESARSALAILSSIADGETGRHGKEASVSPEEAI